MYFVSIVAINIMVSYYFYRTSAVQVQVKYKCEYRKFHIFVSKPMDDANQLQKVGKNRHSTITYSKQTLINISTTEILFILIIHFHVIFVIFTLISEKQNEIHLFTFTMYSFNALILNFHLFREVKPNTNKKYKQMR